LQAGKPEASSIEIVESMLNFGMFEALRQRYNRIIQTYPMPTIHSRYLGNLRTEQTHLASGSILITDAPIDNQGKGEAFSPTDSVCAALSACMITLMGIASNTHQIPFEGIEAEVTKFMSAAPRKIEKIEIRFWGFDQSLNDHQKKILERAALTCPVGLSLDSDIDQAITFEF
jgi:uncharacterized OsmC-like protein